ncbi:ABC transporter ATP-binding protein [Paenibacillus beijingensis]|uniref:Peptide ABC transporter ATP-binding protein n=1 Tax=Paenibacillus beijingensis TaxID=1126833 RepID=A0A0D5NQZ9_9BACL|nr:ABC transporter ATP-binding protein [Paenibacillus beijingensis]AJY77671.1 peptide ABC transporter ATP-binding protein [Paenibacillus beijingensis]
MESRADGNGSDVLLRVEELKTRFDTVRGTVTAVDGVQFTIRKGEILGVVGESGCGKSVTSRSIMRLYDENKAVSHEGGVFYKNENLLSLSKKRMRQIRGNEIAMIFQDTLSSLNPVYSIGSQIAEAVRRHTKCGRKHAYEKAVLLLADVGIPDPAKRVHEFPHQLSGGMRQRVMIAMALACEPGLLIADEPTTALDVTIQSQILDLISSLQERYGMSIMLITHDLGVVTEICTRVVVMYLGQIIEDTDVSTLFRNPLHPYTQGLLQSMPKADSPRSGRLSSIPGVVPSLHHVPAGCRFAGRCPHADHKCLECAPKLESVEDGHLVRCWHYRSIRWEGGTEHGAQSGTAL